MEIEIKKLGKDDISDFVELIKVFEVAFEMKKFVLPNNIHLQKKLSDELFLVFVAKAKDKILGGLTVYVLNQYYSEKPLAYIYDVAVLPQYQRKGIGKKLLSALSEYCRRNGFEEIYVQADNIDEHAISFYRKTMPTDEDKVVQFSYIL